MAQPKLLADLTVRKGTSGASVKIIGTTTDGDAPERHFIWNNESLLTADGVDVISVTGVTIGRWIQIPAGGTPKETYYDFAAGEDTVDFTGDASSSIEGLHPVQAFLYIYDPELNAFGTQTPIIIDTGSPIEGQVFVNSADSIITLPPQTEEEVISGYTRKIKLISYTITGNPIGNQAIIALLGQKASVTYVNAQDAILQGQITELNEVTDTLNDEIFEETEARIAADALKASISFVDTVITVEENERNNADVDLGERIDGFEVLVATKADIDDLKQDYILTIADSVGGLGVEFPFEGTVGEDYTVYKDSISRYLLSPSEVFNDDTTAFKLTTALSATETLNVNTLTGTYVAGNFKAQLQTEIDRAVSLEETVFGSIADTGTADIVGSANIVRFSLPIHQSTVEGTINKISVKLAVAGTISFQIGSYVDGWWVQRKAIAAQTGVIGDNDFVVDEEIFEGEIVAASGGTAQFYYAAFTDRTLYQAKVDLGLGVASLTFANLYYTYSYTVEHLTKKPLDEFYTLKKLRDKGYLTQQSIKLLVDSAITGEALSGGVFNDDKSVITIASGTTGNGSYFVSNVLLFDADFITRYSNKKVRFEFLIGFFGLQKGYALMSMNGATTVSRKELLGVHLGVTYHKYFFDVDITDDLTTIRPYIQFFNTIGTYSSEVSITVVERTLYVLEDNNSIPTIIEIGDESINRKFDPYYDFERLTDEGFVNQSDLKNDITDVTRTSGGVNGGTINTEKTIISIPSGSTGNASYIQTNLANVDADFKDTYHQKKVRFEYLLKITGSLTGTLTAYLGAIVSFATFSEILSTDGDVVYRRVGYDVNILNSHSNFLSAVQLQNVVAQSEDVTIEIIEIYFSVVSNNSSIPTLLHPANEAINANITQRLVPYYTNQKLIDDGYVNASDFKQEISGVIIGEALGGSLITNNSNTLTVPIGETGDYAYLSSNLLVEFTDFISNYLDKKVRIEFLFKFTGTILGTYTVTTNGIAVTLFKGIFETTEDPNVNYYRAGFDFSVTEDVTAVIPYIQLYNTTPYEEEFRIDVIERFFSVISNESIVPTLRSTADEAINNKVEAAVSALPQIGVAEIETLIVRKNGTVDVDCDFNGNRGIQDAIESITDVELGVKEYEIIFYPGVYEALTIAEYNSAGIVQSGSVMVSFIRGKSGVSLRGTNKETCIIKGEIPDNLTSSIYPYYQTMYWHADHGTLSNCTVTAKNMRYPIHIDGGQLGCKDFVSNIKNVDMIHLGNTNNALTGWSSVSGFGYGSSDGQVINMDNCSIGSSLWILYFHSNLNFDKESITNYRNVKGIHTGTNKRWGKLQSLGSHRPDIVNIENCYAENAYLLLADSNPYIPTALTDQSYNHCDMRVTGFGNQPFLYQPTFKGLALKITTIATGASATVRFDITSTAFNTIIKDKDYGGDYTDQFGEVNVDGYAYKDGDTGLAGYGIGRLDIGGEAYGISVNTYGKSLGKRLGNCSTVNKTLTIEIGGVDYDIVFDKNYIGSGTASTVPSAYSNATILAEINAVIGSVATASEWAVGNDYYPEFSDVLKLVRTSEIVLKGMAVFNDNGLIRKATAIDKKIFGVALDDITIGNTGRILTSGYLETLETNRFSTLQETYTTIVKGDELGISATSGKLSKSATIKHFNCFADGIVSFNI